MIKIDYTSNINLSAKKSEPVTDCLPVNDPRRPFLTVGDGLNMKGSCKNPSCLSATYGLQNNVWVMKRFHIFDVGLVKYKNFCPGCNTKMQPSSFKEIGYRNAKVTVEGTKLTNYGGIFIRTIEEDYTGNLIMFGSKEHSPSEWS